MVNPAIRNSTTGEHIGFDTTLNKGGRAGDLPHHHRPAGRQAHLRRRGTNAFALLDEDSDLMELHPGDNVPSPPTPPAAGGPAGQHQLYPMSAGILPEVK